MSESDSESGVEFAAERDVQRLRTVLFDRKPKKRSGVHSLAVEAQRLTDDAKAFVSQVTEGLTIEVPKELKDVALPEAVAKHLDTRDLQQCLKDQTSLVIEERQREIEETQHRLERALEELAIVKREEEELLQQKVLECRQTYIDDMTRLQKQYIAQADDLKMATMTQLAQYRSQCETTVETKAKSLCANLATDARTLPPSPRMSPSPDSVSRSPRRSPAFAQVDDCHRKVVTESRRSMDMGSSASRDRAHRRHADRSAHHRSSTRSVDYRRQQIEPSFRFRDPLPETPEPLPIRSRSERRSFLQLLDSDEE